MVMGSPSQCPCCGKLEMSCVRGRLCGNCQSNYEDCKRIVDSKICTRCKGTGFALKPNKCMMCTEKATHSAILNGTRFALCKEHLKQSVPWDGEPEEIPEPIQEPSRRVEWITSSLKGYTDGWLAASKGVQMDPTPSPDTENEFEIGYLDWVNALKRIKKKYKGLIDNEGKSKSL